MLEFSVKVMGQVIIPFEIISRKAAIQPIIIFFLDTTYFHLQI